MGEQLCTLHLYANLNKSQINLFQSDFQLSFAYFLTLLEYLSWFNYKAKTGTILP
jgi:hypothetical protein